MDAALLLEYGWVLLVLIALEGIVAADMKQQLSPSSAGLVLN